MIERPFPLGHVIGNGFNFHVIDLDDVPFEAVVPDDVNSPVLYGFIGHFGQIGLGPNVQMGESGIQRRAIGSVLFDEVVNLPIRLQVVPIVPYNSIHFVSGVD